jgi:hypothetical integral membrane protein (TIGR02206 family)
MGEDAVDGSNRLPLFGPLHLTILAATLLVGAGLAWMSRESPAAGRRARIALGIGLAVNECIWYIYRYSKEGLRFPEGLPLQLCDIAVWVTVIACLRLSVVATELDYFAGLGGSAMAVLTPDLWAACPSYPSIYFFLAHGGVIVAVAMLVFGRIVILRKGCVWRVFGLVNVYVGAVAVFNWIFGTNYLYLCRKPGSASMLDLFGPWPLYILVAEAFALALFAAMWLAVPRPTPRVAAA